MMLSNEVHGEARRTVVAGAERIRSYGRADEEYQAAVNGVALIDRGGDAFLTITGPKAHDMLKGVATGRMPAAATGEQPEAGEATHHTVLTPKGKMISDLRLGRDPDAEGVETLWALVPAGGLEGLLAHFGRFLPPRFSRVTDRSAEVTRLTVVGPQAAELISRVATGLRIEAHELSTMQPGEFRTLRDSTGDVTRIIRTGEVSPPAFDLIVDVAAGSGMWTSLVSGGAVPMGAAAWEVLRVEAETPVYGLDMDDSTIPTEAGLENVAIDHTKGCYTGQEVIVRIRDRGHVNRRLRLVQLSDQPTPPAGAELFIPGREKVAGQVRSAVQSPRYDQTIALAYVRRDAWDGTGDQPAFVVAGPDGE